ncbi:hypothetical protein Q7C_1088 [Methylophaga frappieri]|uniref:Uncharacterized protein n=1 Tax=Methylophaga frappieri (strain ATCC BAA-2434 / DSM 25690 / JAM7) TaxID=754477 RepID=I1YH50_METFJ|nr:hypothetical protein Q7C_1088 [Methylophaga frappieri]
MTKSWYLQRSKKLVKRIENVVLLKVIGTLELLAALTMFYFFIRMYQR